MQEQKCAKPNRRLAPRRVPFDQERGDEKECRGKLNDPGSTAGSDNDRRRDEPRRRRLSDRRLEGHPTQLGTERLRPVAAGDRELKRGVAQRLDHQQQQEAGDDLPPQRRPDRGGGMREAQGEQDAARDRDRAGVDEGAQDDRQLLGRGHCAGLAGGVSETLNPKSPFMTWPSSETAVHDTS